MTEQERAAALADEVAQDLSEIRSRFAGRENDHFSFGLRFDSWDTIVSALRAYARPAPADLREAIEDIVADIDNGVGRSDRRKIADAILSLLPQTQESDVLTDMRETLQRLIDLTPSRAGSFTADDLHLSVKAISASAIERLYRAADKEG